MSARRLTTRPLALAAVVAVLAVPLGAQQQDTARLRTTSQRRINVSKGEVALPPRVDTVYVTRYDTVRINNTIVRVDTVTVNLPAPVAIVEPNTWFWSVFAGATSPEGAIDRLYTNGFHFGGQVGYDPKESWWGSRLALQLSQVGREGGRSTLLVGSGTPLMWQFSGDMKLKWNVGGWTLYGLGGLGFNSYNRMATVAHLDDDVLVVNPLEPDDFTACERRFNNDDGVLEDDFTCYRLANTSWDTKFSWNFGLGTDFHIGRQDMFFEWRWNPIQTHGGYTWYMPISLGIRYF